MASAEQQARDMLERAGVEDAQSMTAGDLVEIANLIDDRKGEAARRTREENSAIISNLARLIQLQHELRAERDRCNRWRELANGYDDVRDALRSCDDDAEGHAQFYREASLIIFGQYNNELADATEVPS